MSLVIFCCTIRKSFFFFQPLFSCEVKSKGSQCRLKLEVQPWRDERGRIFLPEQNPTKAKELPTQLSLPQLKLQLCFSQSGISQFVLQINVGNGMPALHYSQHHTWMNLFKGLFRTHQDTNSQHDSQSSLATRIVLRLELHSPLDRHHVKLYFSPER